MADYFVDATLGNDGAAGTSELAPWKSLDPKVNGESFAADDFINLKKDEEWRETLVQPDSGSEGSDITVRPYGTGAGPNISGADLIETWASESSVTAKVPSDIASLEAWYKADALSLNDGDAVASWADSSGNGHTAAQGTGANQPTFKTAIRNGLPVVRFDGSDWVTTAAFGSELSQPNTILVVVKRSSGDYVIDGLTTNKRHAMWVDGGGSPFNWNVYAGAQLAAAGTQITTKFQIIAVDYNGASSQIRVDGSQEASGNAGTDALDGLTIGARFSEVAALNGDIAEILVFDGLLSAGDIASMEAYLSEKYALTLGTPLPDTYSATLNTEPSQVFLDDTRLVNGTSEDLLNDHEWYWTGNELFVRDATGDPDGTGVVIEASVRDNCISVPAATDYVTFQNLIAEKGNVHNVQLGGSDGGCDNITFDGVDSFRSYYTGALLDSGTNDNTAITFQNGEVAYCGGNGIQFGRKSNACFILNNVVHHNCPLDIVSPGAHKFTAGIKVTASDPDTGRDTTVTVEGNEVYANGVAGVDAHARGKGIWFDVGAEGVVQYNDVHDNLGNTADGISIEWCHDTPVHYNLVYRNGRHGINLTQDPKRNEVFNNTIFENGAAGISVDGDIGGGGSADDNLIKNNISVENGAAIYGSVQKQIRAVLGGENAGNGSGNVYEYNCLGVEAANFVEWGNGTLKDTYADWETAYGGGTNSVEADPLFVDAANDDFTKQDASPCIQAGTWVGLKLDYAGNPVVPGAVDVGAYQSEYGGGDQINTSTYWRRRRHRR